MKTETRPQAPPKRRRARGFLHKAADKAMKMLAYGYGEAGASTTKRALKGFLPSSGSADRDIGDYNPIIRQRARMLYMSSPIATSAIRTNRTNVIGVGLVPKPTIDAEVLGMTPEEAVQWQKKAEREFALWANDKRACDATGTNNFYGLQQLGMVSWLVSGDVFAIIQHVRGDRKRWPYTLRVLLIEADRVSNPDLAGTSYGYSDVRLANGNWCHDGVEVNKRGAIVAYHVRNSYPQDWDPEGVEYVRIPAYGSRTGLPNVLHIMDSERPEQYRGVSYLAQIIEPLLQTRRYTEFELSAALVQSMFTAWIKTNGPSDIFPFAEVIPEGEKEVSRDPDDYEMSPGGVNVLEPDEDIVFGDPKRPTSGFEPFVHTVAEEMGAATEIPVDLLLKSFNASYSASRAALLEAWKSFRMRRRWFEDDFCRPIWEIWMSEAVALGRLEAPGFFEDPIIRQAYLGCEWVGPSQGQLDPTKEISAEVLAIEQGLTTRKAAAQRIYGTDWDENMDQIEYENRRLSEASPITEAIAETVGEIPTQNATSSIEEGNDDEPSRK